MEDLGTILRRITSKGPSTERLESKRKEWAAAVKVEPCQRCNGDGFLTKGFSTGQTPDGRPCPDCNPRLLLGQGKSFADFEPVPGTEQMVIAAKFFAESLGSLELIPGLTIVGQNGNGKTHIVEAVANAAIGQGKSPAYVFIPDFLDQLRSSFDPENDLQYTRLWEWWSSADLLILDDLKHDAKPTPWAVEQIERIIDWRYRKALPYIVTTNGTLDSIQAVWRRRVADRVFDERSGSVTVVYNTAPSYRTGKAWK